MVRRVANCYTPFTLLYFTFYLVCVFDVDGRLGESDAADDSAAERHRDVILLGVQRLFQRRLLRHVEQLRDEILAVARSANQKQAPAVAAYLYSSAREQGLF